MRLDLLKTSVGIKMITEISNLSISVQWPISAK